MSERISTARHFRKSIFSEFRRYQTSPDAEPDTAFCQYLESEYEKAKSRLSNLINQGASASDLKAEKNGLFIISIGLFTFGRLDVAEDIVDNIPGGRGRVNHLAGVVNRLLPLPPGLSPFGNPDAIKEWLKQNRCRLSWDENLETYILED
ncbi:hypothetical protein NIES2100_22110 [Calothrix sp. NIES-2100]|uniref:hypothetical protein n=1 Tax=Calothrix sp. NIES-2100 TaxID=1954172 RepID=UPI000B5FBC1C|nr:hypothetical protein NIES2100_22110 [Calothrix sp. NIES-2100]